MNATPGTMIEALPNIERVREEHAKLVESGVRYVFSCWIDLHGLPKTKPVPISRFRERFVIGKGPQFAVHSVSLSCPSSAPADSDQIPGARSRHAGDLPLGPAPAPGSSPTCGGKDKPYNMCPRQALKRTIRDTAARKAYVDDTPASSPNSSPCSWDEKGLPVKAFDERPSPRSKACARAARLSVTTSSTRSTRWTSSAIGDRYPRAISAGGIHDVVCRGRLLAVRARLPLHRRALGMADRLVFLRVLLKEVAKKHGMFVTFMPKPTTGDWRSGAHMNYVDRQGRQGWQGHLEEPVYEGS